MTWCSVLLERDFVGLENEPDPKNEEMIDYLKNSGYLRTPRIIEAFRFVKRRSFVPKELMDQAYGDFPLPTIGDSTISQPSTVAVMVEELSPKIGERILEIGSGSGYNACIMAFCVGKRGKIITLEIDKAVSDFAKSNIQRTGLNNIEVINRDGSDGYRGLSQYNKIVYTAAVQEVPETVFEQLKINGRLLAPIGYGTQILTSFEKVSSTNFIRRELGSFLFVPARKN
jgi:protein-L-isoaspartate(D-aspartate) O-methyltransferase